MISNKKHKYSKATAITLALIFCAVFKVNAAQKQFMKPIDNVSDSINIVLHRAWKFHSGDNKVWAATNFDDSSWDTLSTALPLGSTQKKFKGIGWFRIHLTLDSSQLNKVFYLKMRQYGASDIYLNGNMIHQFGKVGTDAGNEKPYNPYTGIYLIHFTNKKNQVIAVRYSAWQAINLMKSGYNIPMIGYEITLKSPDTIADTIGSLRETMIVSIILFSIFLTLAFLHLLLFLYYKKLKANFYYSIVTFLISLVWLAGYFKGAMHDPILLAEFSSYIEYTYPILFLAILMLLYTLFRMKFSKFFWINVAVAGLTEIFIATTDTMAMIGLIACVVLPSIDIVRIIISAIRKKKDGAWIIGAGFLIFAADILLLFLLVFVIAVSSHGGVNITFNSPIILFLFFVWIFSIPVSMSIYLAREFSYVNKNLQKRLIEVNNLSEKTIKQEKEKQQIIQGQKEELEIQVAARTKEVVEQKIRIEDINKNITDSINYAKKIQEAILPDKSYIRQYLTDSFIMFLPRDIVSGDFYWFADLPDGSVVLATADCTGHGVPGAFMSMIGKTLLDKIVNEMDLHEPDKILTQLHKSVQAALKQDESDSESRDGMDIALCRIYKDSRKIIYSGAMRPLWIVRNNGELEEIKATKQAIGGRDITERAAFELHKIELGEGDAIYMSSDGFADQFGGKDGKKLKVKNLKELLQKIAQLPIAEQQKELIREFQAWKGNQEQVDDVLVIGVKM